MFGAAVGGVGRRRQWERGRQEQGLQAVQAPRRMQAAAETDAVAGIPEGAVSTAHLRCCKQMPACWFVMFGVCNTTSATPLAFPWH